MPELLLSLNLLTSWTLHILYNISHWQLQILAPLLEFSVPKKMCHWGDCPPPCSPGHHATGHLSPCPSQCISADFEHV